MKITSYPALRLPCCTALLATALAAALGPAWGGTTPTSGFVQYQEIDTLRFAHAQPVAKVMKLWFRGQNFRRTFIGPDSTVDMIAGPQGRFLKVGHSDDVFQVTGKWPRSHGIPGLGFPDSGQIHVAGRRVGRATIGQYKTEIYELRTGSAAKAAAQKNPAAGPVTTRYWISRDLPVPVKVEMRMPHSTSVFTLERSQFNFPVDAGMFTLPKGSHILAASQVKQWAHRLQQKSAEGGSHSSSAPTRSQ